MAEEKKQKNKKPTFDEWIKELDALFISLGSPLEHDNSKVGQHFITIYKKPSTKPNRRTIF